MNLFNIEARLLQEVNTDPQRRCYYGCHAKSELIWSCWTVLNSDVPENEVARKLAFWRDLNAYAVSQRGEANTLREHRAVLQKH